MIPPAWRRGLSTAFWIVLLLLAVFLWMNLLTPSLPWPATTEAPLGYTEAARSSLDANPLGKPEPPLAAILRTIPGTTTAFVIYESPSGLGAAKSASAMAVVCGGTSGRVLAVIVQQRLGWSFPRINQLGKACVGRARHGAPGVPASSVTAEITEVGSTSTIVLRLAGLTPRKP